MSTLTTINAGDSITSSRTVLNANMAALNTDKIETSVIDTDTTLGANSDAKIPSQKAVKAYVDAGGNVNASTTARGIVEEATLAETVAQSGTGATGARLFVNPSTSGPLLGLTTLLAGETINGATLPVPVYQNKTDNELYACDANDNTKYKFIGFAVSNGTDGNAIGFQGSGIVSGFTGLAEGEKYYVQDAVGTIGPTAGTQEILVGVAISETQLLIQKGTLKSAGNIGSIGTASSSLAVTCGFRPSRIRLVVRGVENNTPAVVSTLDAVWLNNTLTSVGMGGVDTQAVAGSGAILYDSSASTALMTFTITSVTDTGFTITWTETGTFSMSSTQGVWEAEGDL